MRKPVVVLSLALLASVAMSAWLWSELRAERALNAELTAQRDDPKVVAKSLPDVSSHSLTATAQAAPPAPVAPSAPMATAPPATTPPNVTRREDFSGRQRDMLQDPRYREIMREQRRLTYARRRDNIMRLVGLTPEQADAVIDLQVDNELDQMYGNMGGGDYKQLQARIEAADTAHQAKLRELLGEQKYDGLQRYMESRQTRMQVDEFRNHLGGADMLREDQVEPLIAALHVENSQMRKQLDEYQTTLGWQGDPDEGARLVRTHAAELREASHSRMHDAAAAILSPSQLARFDDLLRRERERREMQERLERLQAKTRGVSAD